MAGFPIFSLRQLTGHKLWIDVQDIDITNCNHNNTAYKTHTEVYC